MTLNIFQPFSETFLSMILFQNINQMRHLFSPLPPPKKKYLAEDIFSRVSFFSTRNIYFAIYEEVYISEMSHTTPPFKHLEQLYLNIFIILFIHDLNSNF